MSTHTNPYTLAMPCEFVLENGLRVVTLSTPTLKSADVRILFNAGGRDDPVGEEGTAHFLEHMMFNGTLTRHGMKKGVLPVMQQVGTWGGTFNANTTWNRTEYSISDVLNCYTPDNESRHYLENAIDLLLETVQYPRLREDDMERERSVINSEAVSQTNSMDTAQIYSGLQSVIPDARTIHTIGTEATIQNITAEKLRKFWQENYTPSNAMIFIQGQGTDEELFAMVCNRLTILGASDDTPPNPTLPNFTAGESRIEVPGAPHIIYQFSWDVASGQENKLNVREEKTVAFIGMLLSQYLMHQMREVDGIVYHVQCASDMLGGMKIELASDKPVEQVIESMRSALTDFLNASDAELQELFDNTKLMVSNAAIHQLDKHAANSYLKAGEVIAQKNCYTVEDNVKALNAVTLEDIQELAARIFGKPFALALAGKPEMVRAVPSKESISQMLNIIPNDKPIGGFLETDASVYDPRHGEKEPRPNPVNHGYVKKSGTVIPLSQ